MLFVVIGGYAFLRDVVVSLSAEMAALLPQRRDGCSPLFLLISCLCVVGNSFVVVGVANADLLGLFFLLAPRWLLPLPQRRDGCSPLPKS